MFSTQQNEVKVIPGNPDAKAKARDPERIVFVGAGPVGLYIAIELKKALNELIKEMNQILLEVSNNTNETVQNRKEKGAETLKEINMVMIERHERYVRTQEVKLDITTIKDKGLRQKIIDSVIKDKRKGNNIFIPIETLEKFLKQAATQLDIQFVYKQFMSESQYNEAKENGAIKMPVIVGTKGILNSFPGCQLLIGSDGARSSVRQLLVDDDQDPIDNEDLRKMIELTYKVNGMVQKMPLLNYYHTQTLLDGFLCQENVKYNASTNISEITLRFLVDNDTFNHHSLKGANAKNPLLLTENIPKKLKNAINIWLNKRGDLNIKPKSAKLNKISLAVYHSKKYIKIIDDIMVVLAGDASCGFPFMNGLNIGLETGFTLVQLVTSFLKQYFATKKMNLPTFCSEYDMLLAKNFAKGLAKVTAANAKISKNQTLVTSAFYSSLVINLPMKKILREDHPILDAASILTLKPLMSYVNTQSSKPNSPKYLLSYNLLDALTKSSDVPAFLKTLLNLAYEKNRIIENKHKEYNPLSSFSLFPTLSKKEMVELDECRFSDLTSLEEKEVLANERDIVPEKLTSPQKKLSQGLHKIIRNLYIQVCNYEVDYKEEMSQLINQNCPRADLIRAYTI